MDQKQLIALVEQLLQRQGLAEEQLLAVKSELAALQADHKALQQEHAELLQKHAQLQSDYQQLRHDYETLLESSQTLLAERERLQERVAELEAANNKLTNMLWGRRSERREEPGQLHLWEPEQPLPTDADPAVIMAAAEAQRLSDEELLRQFKERCALKRELPRSEELPAHLPRRERIVDLSEDDKQALRCVGQAVTERLRFEKPTLYVERIVRPKYVHEGDAASGVIAAPVPPAMIEGGKHDPSVHAAVVALKYGFHLTTYREQEFFSMLGWFPSRSTINELMNQSCDVVSPLYQQIRSMVMSDSIVMGDDTQTLLLTRSALSSLEEEQLGKRRSLAQKRHVSPGGTGPPAKSEKQGSATSYVWLYRGLDDGQPYNYFHWTLTHDPTAVGRHLKDFSGTLVGDAFDGNAQIASQTEGRIRFAACNAHARREFIESEKQEPILSSQAISFFRHLYAIEERGRLLTPSNRLELRQQEALPVWGRTKAWCDQLPRERMLPKSPFGKAVTYLTNQWTALQVYLSDGRIPIDNISSERTLRPWTIGRKNWLFLGHPEAAERRLQLYSVVSSAVRHQLVLQDYLSDAFRRLSQAQQQSPRDLELGSDLLLSLLPDRWAAAHPESICVGRREESRHRSEVVRMKRARYRLGNQP